MLGGGLVPGSLVLIGGSPGIGKSTITGGALGNLAAAGHASSTSPARSRPPRCSLRAERLGEHALSVPIVAETDLETVVATLEAERPDVCVVDSVQTLYDPGLTGAPGSVGQVREVAGRLMRVAKERGMAVMLVGHVTKEGALAGPRVLEHLVDCVLQFEGERERTYRTLRALKNRFGSTNEVGVFEMRERGLVEVEDASARFVERGHARARLGRAVRDGGLPAAARGGPGAGGAQRAGAAAPGGQRRRPQPARAGAGRAGAPRRRRASARATSSSRSLAACGWTSRARTWRSRWRWRPPRRACRSAPAASRWRPSARSGSPASCATWPTPTAAWPRPAKFGLERACLARRPTLRTLRQALRPGSGRGRPAGRCRIERAKTRCKGQKTPQMQGTCP